MTAKQKAILVEVENDQVAHGRVSYRTLLPSELIIDPRVQRPRDENKLNKMIGEFDSDALGQITVSERADGTMIILDGQHRWLMVQIVGYVGGLNAKVFKKLTLEEEARLFRLLNNTTKAARLALFHVALTEGNPMALQINGVLRKYGLTMTPASFGAVASAERIARRKEGIAALDWSIDTIQKVWGPDPKHIDGRIVEALAMLRLRDSIHIKSDVLVEKLKAACSSKNILLGKGKTSQEVNNGGIQTALCRVVIKIYNSSIKKDENRLRDWV